MDALSRALAQMERGMGADSTPESRAAVNAETMAARAERQAELESRRNAPKAPAPRNAIQAMTDDEFARRMQSGKYGRLD